MKSQEILVEVQDLRMHFTRKNHALFRKPPVVKAVDGVSFAIRNGEVLGLVGESGCGKTTTGRCILQLYKPTGGKVLFKGQDLSRLNQNQLRPLRREIQLIFEDPFYSLNPRMRVEEIIGEPLVVHKIGSAEEIPSRISEALQLVHLEPEIATRLPHELSAGQRQRIEIARALIMRPSFVVCDNPTSEVDVSIQAQILNLLMWYHGWQHLTYLFISHDLAVVRNICDRVMVMYCGKIVEIADKTELYQNPLHPYTRALLASVPIPDPEVESRRQLIILPGEPASPLNPPPGCRFHTRCSSVMEICRTQEPVLTPLNEKHSVACHRA